MRGLDPPERAVVPCLDEKRRLEAEGVERRHTPELAPHRGVLASRTR